MSLQIWLPLNGDLTNKGLYRITPTLINSALGSTTNSKIGGPTSYSWTTDGAGIVLSNFMPVLKTYTSYTFSAWVYFTGPATNHSTTICSSGDWNQANRQLCFGLYNYNSGYAHVLTPNLNSWSDGVTLPTKLAPNTWYHVTATYDGAVTTVYINGEKVGTYNGGGITGNSNTESLYIGRATYYEGFTIKGTINDFRIYDNCLNPKEVKLLSQGLVWHCKLNSISNPNLVSGITSGGQTTVLSKYSVSVNFGNNADSYFRLTFPSGALALNKTYTLSFDVKDFPKGSSQGWYMFRQGSSNHVFTINRDGHYEWTFSTESGKMPSDYSLTSTILDDGSRSGAYGVYTIYNIKVEEGSSATRWCPHSTDTAQYAIFEKTKNIEDDCSGYGWNGIRYGVTGSGDSARYLHCGQFAYGNYIRTDAFRTVGWTDFTMAAWVNPSTYTAAGGSTDRQTIIIGGMYLTLENGVVSTYCYGKTTAYYNGTTKIPLNTWSHIAVSYDKAGNLKIYVNGTLDKTYTGLTGACADIQFHKQKEIGAETNGGSRQYQGKISDVRIYSTALTEAAIKELYNLGASYTSDGALLTYEINANENTDRIKQSKKSTTAGEFSEIGYIENMKTKVLDDGSAWARIHWLDVSKSETWFSGNEVQDCDKANRFSKMHLVDKFATTSIPRDYTLLEYIESTGTQYIDTEYYWQSENVRVIMDATVTKNSSSQSLFGNEEPNSAGNRYFSIVPHGTNGTYGYYVGGNAPVVSGVATCTIGTRFTMDCFASALIKGDLDVNGNVDAYDSTLLARHVGGINSLTDPRALLNSDMDSDGDVDSDDLTALARQVGGITIGDTTPVKTFILSINGVVKSQVQYSGTVQAYANTTSTHASKGRIYIFANHNSGTSGASAIQNVGGMKLYSFKMYDNNILVRDFIPCKNPQGVTGLYDTVSKKFFTSPVSTFTAGPVANGVYEFMLTYPETTGYNRWTQTSSPNATTVTGLNKIETTWSAHYGGIRKSSGACYYDCDTGGTWYGAIGQTSAWTTGKYIPGADGNSYKQTELWVRIDQLSKLIKFSMLDEKYVQAFEIHEI